MKAIPVADRLRARLREQPASMKRDRLGRPIIGPCWIFTGAVNQYGYGVITISRQIGTALAHRVAYESWRGPITNTLDHLCRVHACCNPDHLEDVTLVENGRRGDRSSPNSKKTRCPKGHPYDETNTRLQRFRTGRRAGTVGRACRECGKERYQMSKRSPQGTAVGNAHTDSIPGADVPGLAASFATTS